MEVSMATISPYAGTERRHIPERRSSSQAHTKMKAAEWIPLALLIIGGINWGLVGLLDIDLVALLFGDGSALSRLIYTLVGISALYSIYLGSRMSGNRV
jgi:uncharacterized membrane protein YuzA (DUF378 family)